MTDHVGDARALAAAIAAIGPLDEAAMAAAATRMDALTKPLGSLGRLEELAVQLAGITGHADARIDRRSIVVAVADHGVTRHSVSAYPADVTVQMLRNFLAGGAAINVLARLAEATLVVLDAGVNGAAGAIPPPVPGPGSGSVGGRYESLRRGRGTADFTVGPAMTRDEAIATIEAGVAIATEEIAGGVQAIGVGEMGIGNTTAASAIVAALTGASVVSVTGPGTGLDEEGRRRKVEVIERALAVNRPAAADPIGVLAAVGGFEIAALVGVIVGAAACRVPVVVDGFITGAAALAAAALCPALPPRLIAAHRSAEPGHAVVLDRLGARPLLELDLRLGEGTGAALAFSLLDAATRLRDQMATFEAAGVAGRAGGAELGLAGQRRA